MTMTLSSRSITRAGALTLAALTFAACSDSTGPLDISPEQLEAIGQTMAFEIESGALQLTAQDAMGTVDAPAFSIQSRIPGNLGGAAFNLQRAAGHPISLQVVDPECGVPSQDPPTDSDADQVPDNLTITFALPACRFVDASGSFELTGAIRVSDPLPGTAAMAFNMALDNFRFAFSMPEGSGFVRRDGLTSVLANESGLSQTVSWLESAQISGYPSVGADIDWSATFAAAQGATITPGEPLPDGVYQPNGSFEFRQANRSAHFTVTTVEPLQYSAECAAGVAAGTALSPFSSGKVRVAVSNDGDMGYAEVTYAACDEASVLYVSR
jgi:hypothetical protein